MSAEAIITRISTGDPIAALRLEIQARKAKNPQYSISAFARDLGVSQSLLSLILSKKRTLTLTQAHKISNALGWSWESKKAFIDAVEFMQKKKAPVQTKLTQSDKIRFLEIEKFHLISEWYHFAILDLSTTDGFRSDVKWISKRLRLPELECRSAIERLLSLGLLVENNGHYRKSGNHIRFLTKTSVRAVRNYHRHMLGKAISELGRTDQESFDARLIHSMSLTFAPSDMEAAKKMMVKFQNDFAKRFTRKIGEEVYQLNTQFFPISTATKKKVKKESP